MPFKPGPDAFKYYNPFRHFNGIAFMAMTIGPVIWLSYANQVASYFDT